MNMAANTDYMKETGYKLSKSNFLRFSIARKFTLCVLLIGLCITIIGSFINFYSTYNSEIVKLNQQVSDYEENQIPLIIEILRTNDLSLLDTILESILKVNFIDYAEISDLDNNLIIDTNTNVDLARLRLNEEIDLHVHDLSYSENGQIINLGTLTLATSISTIYSDIRQQTIYVFFIEVIEMLIISIGIFVLFYSFVGKHLVNISNYAAALKLGHLDKAMKNTRVVTEYNKNDEISRLQEAMETMRLNLKKAYEKGQYAEIEREELISSLQEKNSELERFNYTVSHDLKSPLVTINGFIGLLEQDVQEGDQENIKKDILTIKTAATTMYTLLNNLLELSRVGIQRGEASDISFNLLIPPILKSLTKQIQNKHAVIQVQENMPIVTVEEIRFNEVFLNLIENALKYMQEQKEPKIEIGFDVDTNDKGNIETTFYVKDNGRGIKPEYCPKVFELFERIAVDVEGTGVGLAIVKRIIEIHGGRVWVESEGLGLGATFYFVIPTKEGVNNV